MPGRGRALCIRKHDIYKLPIKIYIKSMKERNIRARNIYFRGKLEENLNITKQYKENNARVKKHLYIFLGLFPSVQIFSSFIFISTNSYFPSPFLHSERQCNVCMYMNLGYPYEHTYNQHPWVCSTVLFIHENWNPNWIILLKEFHSFHLLTRWKHIIPQP